MEQETLHEVALEFAKDHHEMYETSNLGSMYFGFCWGAKWQQEQMYSEEDIKNAFLDGWQLRDGDLPFPKAKKKWFNEFKKK